MAWTDVQVREKGLNRLSSRGVLWFTESHLFFITISLSGQEKVLPLQSLLSEVGPLLIEMAR